MRALVVDDSRTMRAIVSQHLRELNFEVSEAASGLEALVSIRKIGPVDVVLVDWNMPEMSGVDFLKKIREEEAFQNVPVMMVTTESEQGQIVRALAAGAHEYLIKPFTGEALLEKLDLLGLCPAPAGEAS